MAFRPDPKPARLLVVAASVAVLGSGCFHSHHRGHSGGHASEAHSGHDHGGPPPWAPAHGHRRKHGDGGHHGDGGGVQVVFDSERGVYVVIGFPHHYYDAGHYYRFDSGHWEVSAHFEGPWLAVETRKVPASLRHARKKPKKGKKNGNPARWAD
jgi:hypothetical protein